VQAYHSFEEWRREPLHDLTADPHEQRNLLFNPSDAQQPVVAAKFTELKVELARMKEHYQDTDDLYANSASWPAGSADGPWDAYQPTGNKTVVEAIQAAVQH